MVIKTDSELVALLHFDLVVFATTFVVQSFPVLDSLQRYRPTLLEHSKIFCPLVSTNAGLPF